MKKPFYKRWWFWSIIIFILGISIITGSINNSSFIAEDRIAVIMGSIFMILFMHLILFTVYMLSGRSRLRKEMKEKEKELGILTKATGHHIEGLPLAEKTFCELILTSDKFIIIGGGTTFNITIPQLRAAEIKTDQEIAYLVHSSAVKGIAGGLLFGPIGLVVGARAKSKEKKTFTHYLILNYINSSGELVAIMFEAGGFPAQKMVNALRPLIINNPTATVQL